MQQDGQVEYVVAPDALSQEEVVLGASQSSSQSDPPTATDSGSASAYPMLHIDDFLKQELGADYTAVSPTVTSPSMNVSHPLHCANLNYFQPPSSVSAAMVSHPTGFSHPNSIIHSRMPFSPSNYVQYQLSSPSSHRFQFASTPNLLRNGQVFHVISPSQQIIRFPNVSIPQRHANATAVYANGLQSLQSNLPVIATPNSKSHEVSVINRSPAISNSTDNAW